MTDLRGARIHITGIVQGVGFRPFVYGLAVRLGLSGWVRNTSAGVDIEVDGTADALDAFVTSLKSELPPLARMDSLDVSIRARAGFTGFEIMHSEALAGAFQPISPDVSICPDCLRELLDPPTGDIATHSSIAPIAGRVLPSSPISHTIAPIPPCRLSRCVRIVRLNMPIRSTGVFMPSQSPVRYAGRKYGWKGEMAADC